MKPRLNKKTKNSINKTASAKEVVPTLGKIVLVHTKSSSYGFSLLEPKITSIDELKFIEGIQVTGKEGHRMEKKRTLIPFDHVASIVEFEVEEDLWKQSQPKQTQPVDESGEDLVSNITPPPHRKHNDRKRHQNHRRPHQTPRNNYDGHLQAEYDASQYRKFNR